MNDLISREDALTALNGACSNWQDDSKVADIINGLPSAKVTGDLISRADAIKTVHKYFVKEIDKTPHEIDDDGDDVYTDMPTVNSLLACNKELSKALKALPSAEAVSREEYDQLEALYDAVRIYDSSAEAVQGWIPCSERLPNDNREVLISCEWGIDIGQHEEYGWRSEWINHYDDDNVLAWMPLPKPYKGGDSE